MTLGIKYGDTSVTSGTSTDQSKTGFIYFDVVSSYSKSTRGQVTKNPIAGTVFVTDNFTRDNPTLQIQAIISVADIANNLLIYDEDGNNANNYISRPSPVTITGDGMSGLVNALPTTVSQFFGGNNVVITMDSLRTNYREFVISVLEDQMSGRKLNTKTQRYETMIRVMKLYEFTGSDLTKVIPDVVLTGFTVKEDVNSGDALVCDLQFENVRFVQLGKTDLPKDVVPKLKGKATSSNKKGNASGTATQNDVPATTTDNKTALLKDKEASGTAPPK